MPPPPERFNRVLSPNDAYQFTWELEELWKYAPDIMARKVPEALINQAFTWFAIQRFAPMNIPILGVGVHEDPVFELLQQTRRYAVTGIDPTLPGSENLHSHWLNWKLESMGGKYACIFACSVLEHVEQDMAFMSNVHDLLLPGGVGIFTFDFHPTYEDDMPLPRTNKRFYTGQTVHTHLIDYCGACRPVDVPDYSNAKLDFEYENIPYTFASLVIRKPRPPRPQESPL